MLIDSHCHLDRLDLTPFEQNFQQFIESEKAQSIAHMLCVSINLEAYPSMSDLVSDYDCISLSVGVHPNEASGLEPSADQLVELAKASKVVAIGETGLDYSRECDQAIQKERFRNHIRAAILAGKPLIIHMRDAKEDTLNILKEEGADQIGGVLHCFTEDWQTAKAAMDLNFVISFSGIVTFKNATQIQEVARKIADDKFLIETDSPYLAPIPHRGKPNYPHYLSHVANAVANLRGTSLNRVAELSSNNYHALFGSLNGL
jgi:TatD DNase family protein